ncbi:hypothetical protein ACOMHN_002145 [Nucella lapillus]
MAYRPFLSVHHYILIAGFLGLVICDVTTAMTSSVWNNAGKHTVTSSMATINTSRVTSRCVMDCQQMGGCVSVALDPASDTCYLQPTCRPARQGDDGPLAVYTREKVFECKQSEAPVVANAHVTKWRVTPSSLDGDVSCDEDYMVSAEETPQVCCKREACKYSLPRPAKVGLCIRMKGTATRNTRFYINLATSTDDIVLHLNARLNTGNQVKTTVVNFRKGEWGPRSVQLADPSPPFPFAADVPFEMVITALSLYNFTLQVNGAHYGDFTGGLPVTDIVCVFRVPDFWLLEPADHDAFFSFIVRHISMLKRNYNESEHL